MKAFENPEIAASDARLLRQWIDHRDAEAFREIVTRHVNMVFATCRRVSGNAADAEDAVQECFLRLATTDAPMITSLAGWLHRAATRITLSRLRSDRRRTKREERYAREYSPPDERPWTDIQHHVDEAIEELSDNVRPVVVRHFLEGEPQVEIARSLGISPAAVSARLRAGIERIRAHLKRRGFPVPLATLAALLGAHGVEAAPPSLSAALAKVALSGITSSTVGSGSLSGTVITTGVLLTMKKVMWVCAVAVLGLGVWILTWPPGDEEPAASSVQLRTDPATEGDPRDDESLLVRSSPTGITAVAEKRALSVRLVDSEDRSVGGGRVQVRWGEWVTGEVDLHEPAEGRFSTEMGWERLEVTGDGTFVSRDRRGDVANLLAVAPGFVFTQEWVEVPPAGVEDPVVLELDRGQVLRGRVVEGGGDQPVSGASVGVEDAQHGIRLRTPFRVDPGPVELFHEVTTDADGRFEIAGVLGSVWVLKEGFGPTAIDTEYGWEDREHEIPMFPPTSVRLRVFDDDGPVEAFEYDLRPFNASWFADWHGTEVQGFETELPLATRCSVGGGASPIVYEYLGVGARVKDAFVKREVWIPPGTHAEVELHFGRRSTEITGIVLDADGNPIGGAHILVGTPETPVFFRGEKLENGVGTAETALDGKTFVVPVQPGPVYVAAHHADYAVYTSEQLLVRDGHRVQHTVRLPRPASILGTIAAGVARRDGRRVTLTPATRPGGPGFALWGFSKETRSDAAGNFRFEDLPPGFFQVALAGLEEESLDATAEICTQAGRVYRLVIGPKADADVVRVLGRVVSGNAPVEGANVLILGHGYAGSPIALSKSDANGDFLLHAVPPGVHRLSVYAESPERGSAGSRGLRNAPRRPGRSRIVQVEVGPDMAAVEVDLSPVMLEGRVIAEAGAVGGVGIHAASVKRYGHVPVWMAGDNGITDAEGNFRLEGLYRTPYRLWLKKEGYLLKTIDWNPALDDSASILEIFMELSAPGTRVRFQVFDGRNARPFGGDVTAAVYPELEPGGSPSAHAMVVAEGSGGSVSVRGLPAGDYLVRVYPTLQQSEGFALEWLRVRRESGVDQDFQVTLRPGGAIRVRIVTEDGIVPAWSSLELWREDGTPIPPGWHNGLEELFRGETVTPRLPVGTIRLRVSSHGHEPRSVSVPVSQQSTTMVVVEYPGRGSE